MPKVREAGALCKGMQGRTNIYKNRSREDPNDQNPRHNRRIMGLGEQAHNARTTSETGGQCERTQESKTTKNQRARDRAYENDETTL